MNFEVDDIYFLYRRYSCLLSINKSLMFSDMWTEKRKALTALRLKSRQLIGHGFDNQRRAGNKPREKMCFSCNLHTWHVSLNRTVAPVRGMLMAGVGWQCRVVSSISYYETNFQNHSIRSRAVADLARNTRLTSRQRIRCHVHFMC
jgi:hypothetical protein